MNWKIITCTIIFFLTIPAIGQTTLSKDIENLSESFGSQSIEKKDNYPLEFENEFKLIFSAIYHFYKSYVSSQDANNCAFHPSCSTYTFETIRENGVLGIFDAFDRLTRCNGFSPEKYTKHQHSEQLYDPVEKIHKH